MSAHTIHYKDSGFKAVAMTASIDTTGGSDKQLLDATELVAGQHYVIVGASASANTVFYHGTASTGGNEILFMDGGYIDQSVVVPDNTGVCVAGGTGGVTIWYYIESKLM